MTQYQGGKQKIGKEIYEVIKNTQLKLNFNECDYFEPFIGMAGVMRHFASEDDLIQKLYANDLNVDLILMWKAIQKDWKPPMNCDQEEYDFLKNSNKHSAKRGFVGFACSYGGIFFKGLADKYRSTSSAAQGVRAIEKVRKYMKKVYFFDADSYNSYLPTNMVIYCDPPYSTNYLSSKFFKFDSHDFWSVMRKWSKNNLVFISEEIAPSDFTKIWCKRIKTTMQAGKQYDHYECLFISNKWALKLNKKS
jgi:DNA adenine methylase